MKHVVECGCAYDDQKDGIFWCDLHREAGIVRAERTNLLLQVREVNEYIAETKRWKVVNPLDVEVRQTWTKAYEEKYPQKPKSEGNPWAPNLDYAEKPITEKRECDMTGPCEDGHVCGAGTKERVCKRCGGDHLEALTCQERIGVYER